jgi:hypothetical protein
VGTTPKGRKDVGSLVKITLTFSVKVGISPVSSGRIINCTPHHLLAGSTDTAHHYNVCISQHSIIAAALSLLYGTVKENETAK